MDFNFLLGVISVVCGAVMLVYGASLFRFVLAFAGFYLGFILTMGGFGMLGANAPAVSMQYVLAVVLGAACGLILYSLVKLTMYAAGAMLGLVLGLLVASLLPIGGSWIGGQIGLGRAVVGAVFGRKLGPSLTIFASAVAGAYVTVTGLAVLFGLQGTYYGLMPTTAQTLVVFIVFAVISILAQFRVRHLRTLRLH